MLYPSLIYYFLADSLIFVLNLGIGLIFIIFAQNVLVLLSNRRFLNTNNNFLVRLPNFDHHVGKYLRSFGEFFLFLFKKKP